METHTAVHSFLTAKRSAGLSPATLHSYAYHLTHFARCCPELPAMAEPIEAFLAGIPGPRYRWNHYVTLRTFYRWLARRHKRRNPIPQVERPRFKPPPPTYLEKHDLAHLLTHPGHIPRDRALLWLLADTGMRIGEAYSIHPQGIGDGILFVNGKTGPRFVPIQPQVAAMLRQLVDGARDGVVWRKENGELLKLNGLKAAVRRAFRRAGFSGPRMSAHRLRHTFATLWEGSDVEGRAIGGWRTAEMWAHYRHLRLERMVEEHRRFSPVVGIGREQNTVA